MQERVYTGIMLQLVYHIDFPLYLSTFPFSYTISLSFPPDIFPQLISAKSSRGVEVVGLFSTTIHPWDTAKALNTDPDPTRIRMRIRANSNKSALLQYYSAIRLLEPLYWEKRRCRNENHAGPNGTKVLTLVMTIDNHLSVNSLRSVLGPASSSSQSETALHSTRIFSLSSSVEAASNSSYRVKKKF
jgi:hypothetical protein